MTSSFEWSWTISECGNEGTQDPENWTQYSSFVTALFTVYAQLTPVHLTWGLSRMCVACPTPSLNLKFELRPSWNSIHDTFSHRDRAWYNTLLQSCHRLALCSRANGSYPYKNNIVVSYKGQIVECTECCTVIWIWVFLSGTSLMLYQLVRIPWESRKLCVQDSFEMRPRKILKKAIGHL